VVEYECNANQQKEMDNLYDAFVEPDGRIRLNTSVHLEKGLKALVAGHEMTRIPR
jgi:hypothetical protein